MTKISVRLMLLLTLVATIGCDRVTKHVASSALAGRGETTLLAGTIRLGYAENSGGFLSVGESLSPAARTAVFIVGTGFLLLAMAALAIRFRLSAAPAFGMVLFVAGGMSNWFDRVTRGTVVDFMNVGIGSLRTGIFNVADVAIMLGVGILVVSECRRR